MRAAVLAAVAACSSHPPAETTAPIGNVSAQGGAQHVAAPPAGARCLQVYSPACGCVYSCAPGVPRDDGTFTVTHPFWDSTALIGKPTKLCVDGTCAVVFSVELVCDGICGAIELDPSCHFDADQCVGRSGQGSGR